MILDLGKCPNHKMHESESAGALLEVSNNFQKHKVQYNYYSKKKLGAFRSELKKVKKNGFPIVFPENGFGSGKDRSLN